MTEIVFTRNISLFNRAPAALDQCSSGPSEGEDTFSMRRGKAKRDPQLLAKTRVVVRRLHDHRPHFCSCLRVMAHRYVTCRSIKVTHEACFEVSLVPDVPVHSLCFPNMQHKLSSTQFVAGSIWVYLLDTLLRIHADMLSPWSQACNRAHASKRSHEDSVYCHTTL